MALSDCLEKIRIEQDIAELMLDRSNELTDGGMDQLTADRKVIDEMFQDIESTLVQLESQLNINRDGSPKKRAAAEFAGEIIEKKKTETTEVKPSRPKTKIVQKVWDKNTLISNIERYNQMTVRQQQKNAMLANDIQLNAKRLGFDLTRDGRAFVLSQKGAPVRRDANKTDKDLIQEQKLLTEYPQEFQQFINDMLLINPTLRTVMIGGLGNTQREQAAGDIVEGRKTVASMQALNGLSRMYDSGGIDVWDEGSKAKVSISLEQIEVERNLIIAEKNGDSLDNYSYLDAEEAFKKGLLTKREYEQVRRYIESETAEQSENEEYYFAELSRNDQGSTEGGRETTEGEGKPAEPAGKPEVEVPAPTEFAGQAIEQPKTPQQKAQDYIRGIKNKLKKEYARDYSNWILKGRPEGKEPGRENDLSYMAAQAVRMELDKIYRKEVKEEKPTELKPSEFAGEVIEPKKPGEPPKIKQPEPVERKEPDYKSVHGQKNLLIDLAGSEEVAEDIQNRILELRKIEDPTDKQLKELRERKLAYETVFARVEKFKSQVDNTIIPAEKVEKIKILIRENNARNTIVSNRIIELQGKRNAKEKSLQKRNELLGDRKAEEEKKAGEQSLFAGDKLFAPESGNLITALKPYNDAIKKSEEEWKRNDQLLDEQIDLVIKGTQQEIKYEEEKKEEIEPEPPMVADTKQKDELELDIIEQSKPTQRIEDFGEKIGGAKKDIRNRIKKSLDVSDGDLLSNPLGKTLPSIDYSDLVNKGVATKEEAAFISIMRSEIKPRPKKSWKQKRWLEDVKAYMDALSYITDKEQYKNLHEGKTFIERVKGRMSEGQRDNLDNNIKTLLAVGFPDVTSLNGYRIRYFNSKVMVRMKEGKEIGPTYSIVKNSFIIKDFATWEEAAAALKYILTTETEAPTQVKFDVWRLRGKDGLFIGKKLGASKFITLAGPFEKVSEVREYIKSHQEELEKLLEEKKIIPYERPETLSPRTGKDYRNGKDATAEMFTEAFGFRGVQFGNWVEQTRRQSDLNNTYDALMDLAEIINVTPKALSLAGELGIAFGARGSGGKNAPSAHYEPDMVVINITKEYGAGSLAHEWFHAVDNYFERRRGNKLSYITNRPRQLITKEGVKDETVRPEVLDAFDNVVKTIYDSELRSRSKELDKLRTKDYWSTTIEMGARSFESYVRSKLADQGIKNDYLVSFKDLVDYILAAGGEKGKYPYPTKEESENINKAFDELFKTIQVKTDENNVSLLYEKAEKYIKKNKVYSQAAPKTDWPEGVSFVSERARGNISGQISLFGENDYSPTPERGDVTYTERILTNRGKLEFIGEKLTGPGEVRSSQDIAFIFKNLESAATENSFAVLIDKNNKYKVLYISTGGTSSTLIDTKLITTAAREFNAEKVVFVHNHPSGKLEASDSDRQIHSKISQALEPLKILAEESVIIDIDSGKYAVFTAFGTEEYTSDKERQKSKTQEILDVYQFDRQKLYTPSTELTRITNSRTVAEYLSKMKRGAVPKLHAIILNRQNNITRYVLYDETISKEDLAKELIYEVGKHGDSVILASNNEPAGDLLLDVNFHLKNIDSQLLDYIVIKQSDDIINNYQSYGDEGLMSEPGEEYNITEAREPEFAGEYLESDILTNAAERYREQKAARKGKEVVRGIREYIQDINLPVRNFEEEILKSGGKQDNDSKPYRDSSLAFGRQEKLYKDYFEQKMKPVLQAISEIKKTGVPGEEILPYIISKHAAERNPAFRAKEFDEWMESNPDANNDQIDAVKGKLKNKDYSGVMQFDSDKNGNPRGNYENPDELANDIVKSFEKKVDDKLIDDLWKNVKEATNSILNTWDAGNQISTEQKQEYLGRFKYYVPLRGWREGAAKELIYTHGEGFSRSFQHAEGRKSLADNPLAYLLQVEFQAIAEQVDNEVKTSMLNLIVRNLSIDEIYDLATVKKLYYVKVQNADGSYEWEPTIDRPSAEMFASGDAKVKIYRQHERLRARRNAREHEVIVHKPGGDLIIVFKNKQLPVGQALNKQNYMYRSIFGGVADARLDPQSFFARMAVLNNMLKATYTSWNIVFPFTNFMRDFQEAAITQAIKSGSGTKVVANYKSAFPAIMRRMAGKSDMKNKVDIDLEEFYNLGGATGYTHNKSIEEIENDVNKAIKRMVRKGTVTGSMQNITHGLVAGIEYWNRLFEDATRFSVYLSSIAVGNTKEDAAYDAKEASVNFNRKGKGSKSWDAWFAFFNVAVQSMQKNFKLAKDYPKAFSTVAFSFVMLGFLEALMNAMTDDDDEDSSYYNINPYMRQNYLVIPNIPKLIKSGSKGDKYLSIPLPQFWRGFKSMGAIAFDIATKRMKPMKGIMEALGNFGAALLPVDIGGFYRDGEFSFAPLVPTVIKPIVEVAENKNYMGFQIKNEPFTLDDKRFLANAGLGKKNASPAAKFFTDLLFRWGGGENKYKYYYDEDLEQRKIPFFMDINPSTVEHLFKGYTGGTGGVLSDMVTTISQSITGDVVDFRNVPFINRFIRKTPEAKWNVISEYYDNRDDAKIGSRMEKDALKKAEETGDWSKVSAIYGNDYVQQYKETFRFFEGEIDDAIKLDKSFDIVEGSKIAIEYMKECNEAITTLKDKYNKK